jgi:signal peptidase complex subunit 3
MMTLWNRANAVFFYAVSVLICLAAASSVTTLWLPATPVVRVLRVNKLKSFRVQKESMRPELQDRAVLSFDLDADLTGVFNWNVKQLFVYVSATYAAPGAAFNEVVIWDAVVQNASAARLRLENVYNKYPLIDRRTDLRGAPVTLALSWDVMPITGVLKRAGVKKAQVRMPAAYCADAACAVEELPWVDEAPPAPPPARAPPPPPPALPATTERSAANWAADDL